MKCKKPFCITFAGPVGSSKTPIAHYLSCKLNLPIFNNDAIRTEVIEDTGRLKENEYIERRNNRIKKIIQNKTSFIYDTSIDRQWKLLKKWLEKSNYSWFIISLDLSKNFLIKIHKAKGYKQSLRQLNKLLKDHDMFISQYGHETGMHISDQDFERRLELCYKKVKKWIK